jgi:NitT/TauT family transport system ATP-binding protein
MASLHRLSSPFIFLAIEPHEFVSVIGPSGCGKSALLPWVARFCKPT